MSNGLSNDICTELLPAFTQVANTKSDWCAGAQVVMSLEGIWQKYDAIHRSLPIPSIPNPCNLYQNSLNEPGVIEQLTDWCNFKYTEHASSLYGLALLLKGMLQETGTLILFDATRGKIIECVGQFDPDTEEAVNISPLQFGFSSACPDCQALVCPEAPPPPPTDWTDACCQQTGLDLQKILDMLRTI